LAERRDKLVDGIVATVQDEWLSPEVIGAKLAAFAPSSVIVDWLRDPEHVGRLGGPLRDGRKGAGLDPAFDQQVEDGVVNVVRNFRSAAAGAACHGHLGRS